MVWLLNSQCLLLPCFFPARFLNMCKPRTPFYVLWRSGPTGLAFYGSGPVGLPNWLGMVKCDQKFACKWNLSFFKAAQLNRLPFYLGSPLHIISSLFSHFSLFQNAILYKMLKLGFWNFKTIFLRILFSLVEIFFSVVLVICLSWYFDLKLSLEFLAFISFTIWR